MDINKEGADSRYKKKGREMEFWLHVDWNEANKHISSNKVNILFSQKVEGQRPCKWGQSTFFEEGKRKEKQINESI